MRSNLRKKIIIVSRIALIVIHVQCLLGTMLLANVGNAQYMKDIYLSVSWDEASIDEVFKTLNKETGFNFLFEDKEISGIKGISLKLGNESLEEILKELSEKNELQFKRVNNTISVKKIDVQSTSTSVRVVELEEVEITGVITDENGEALPGASIIERGTANGTTTDLEGNYKLTTSEDATLVISFVGYQTQELAIAGRSAINIQMAVDAEQLEEVLVVGYGTQRKSDITGSISTVDAVKNIQDRPLNNAEQAIQGSVAGVTVVNNGGDPTSSPKVTIRGVGTTSDSNPLWVVDGVPQQDPTIISSLNPADIASMTVLKDASASAIYGVRAANGVILITTKRGESGELSVNFNTYHGVAEAWKKPKALTATEYAEVENQARMNDGNTPLDAFSATANPDGRIQRTDWIDEIFQTGILQNFDLSVRGGSENATFATSVGYYKRTGTLLNTEKRRLNFRINSDFKLSDKLSIGESIWMSHSSGQGLDPTNEGDVYENNILLAIYANPNSPVREADGSFSGPAPIDSPFASSFEARNPVQDLTNSDITNPNLKLTGNFFVDYQIHENLKFKSSFGVNLGQDNYKEFRPSVPNAPGNRLIQRNIRQVDWVSENTLTFNKNFNNKHNLTVLAGYTLQSFAIENFEVTGTSFGSETQNQRFLSNATAVDLSGTGGFKSENSLLSWLGRANYSFNGKYSVTASLRRDATSRLTKSNRVGWFPSVGLAWNIIEEGFMQNVGFISDLRFRGGWGEIGNIASLGDYATDLPLENVTSIGGAGALPTSGQAIDGISNPDLKWEKTQQLNIGLDAYFFDNKVSFTADYFVKTTKDILLQLPVNALAGVSTAPFVNAGEIQNKGFELALGYRKIEGDFTYSISGNVSRITNEVVSLGSDIESIQHDGPDAVFRNSFFPLRSIVGEPLYSYYVIEHDGIFQSDEEAINYTDASGNRIQPLAVAGDLKFKDTNGDGQINDQDRVYKGNAFPDFSYGLNANFEYKNFDLTLFLQGVSGADVYSSYKNVSFNVAQNLFNRDNRILGAWSSTNTGSEIPRLTKDGGSRNFDTVSDWYIQDASYLRVKNITLGYTLPSTVLESLKLSNFRFYVTGQNLLTLTGYDGTDPEVGGLGVDNGRYPVARTFIVGINVGF